MLILGLGQKVEAKNLVGLQNSHLTGVKCGLVNYIKVNLYLIKLFLTFGNWVVIIIAFEKDQYFMR